MTEKLKEAGKFFIHVLLTALTSAIIAMLQSYIASHGVDAGPTIKPENTAIIGGGLSVLIKAIKYT